MEKEITVTLPLQIIHFHKFVEEMLESNSRLHKEAVLTKWKDDEVIKEILYFIYNKFIVTGIGRSKLNKVIDLEPMNVEFANFKELQQFLKENNTGSDLVVRTIQRERDYYIADEYRELFESIILKDLNLNFGSSSINKVIGENFIPKFDVMLAEKFETYSHLVDDAEFIVTPKLDGHRCVAIYELDGTVTLRTRQGQLYEELDHIVDDIRKHLIKGYVYDGELIHENEDSMDSGELYRLTTRVLKASSSDKTPIKFHIFDSLLLSEFEQGKSTDITPVRKERVEKLLKDKVSSLISVPIIYKGTDVRQIDILLNEAVDRGEEGVMVNISDSFYECKRVRTILKCKKFYTADVLVLDVGEGQGTFKGMLGFITIKFVYEGNEYTSNVGSGFNKEERELYWKNPELLIGKIVEIGYFEVSQNAKTEEYGLRFPTWKGVIRTDKSEDSDISLV